MVEKYWNKQIWTNPIIINFYYEISLKIQIL